MSTTTTLLPESQLGPAERLLDLVLTSSAHLWHNRPGIEVNGVWKPAPRKRNSPKARAHGPGRIPPGLYAPAAEALYSRLLDIYLLNTKLMAHFASYALKETEWRDLKVACAALMLVQPHAGQPIRDDKGAVAFYDDDFRQVGEAMMLFYESKSTKMMNPKAILRIAELLESPGIATLNRAAGFGDPGSKRPPLGRWPKAARHWLAVREENFKLLQGLVKAGYKETIKAIARKCGYKPQSQAFFEVLGWKQSQAKGGHRTVGLQGLNVIKHGPLTGMSEAEICEYIVAKKLSYKETIGRLPPEIGLTPAIMVTLLPSLSDRDLRILTPTLEQLDLLRDPEIKARWDRAIASATDQRSLNIVKNVQNREIREKLEEAADHAVRKAVSEAATEVEVHVMFLIDKSGSMQGAIEASKEVLSRILVGFPLERIHIACFDTMGIVLRPKAPNRAAVQHMLSGLHASGGTVHGAAIRALYKAGVRIPAGAQLLVIVVGDEDGESGYELANVFGTYGYKPAALALILNVAEGGSRGHSIRECSQHLRVPFHEITIDHFADPYQVPRVIRTLIESTGTAGPTAGASHWVEKVMATPILQLRGALSNRAPRRVHPWITGSFSARKNALSSLILVEVPSKGMVACFASRSALPTVGIFSAWWAVTLGLSNQLLSPTRYRLG
ncbi:MAG: vWA domain-containing protein [Myxococcales bacterium]|nr:VWA domain-containing protein [Polyangiaceae bacterium]MDW8247831.1 vWA domain-containing protein [Myxococcales bacterium]